MLKVIDLKGQRFGRLLVFNRNSENDKYGRTRWDCRCDCGNVVTIYSNCLRRKEGTKSCGCLNKEVVKITNSTHGLTDSHEYRVWSAIKRRCYNKNCQDYPDYGGRGITMCDEWRNSFEAFYNDMGSRPSSEHSIDRERNNEGYSKDNCRWATKEEQANNKRTSIFYEINGESKTIAQWCQIYKVSYSFAFYRIKELGFSVEKAIDAAYEELKRMGHIRTTGAV